jgi:L,D-transpeptidase ErfK/SrfK
MRTVSSSLVLATLLFIFPGASSAESFTLPQGPDTVVGEIGYTHVRAGETLVDIAREVNLGYDQIILANPTLNRWIPDEGAKVVVPHQYILPGTARRGVVLNIAELRLYFYPGARKGEPSYVITHPVSIGRMDWRTPLGQTSIIKKERDPPWRPPPSIKREHELDGDPLPDFIAGGAPDNPLGRFALRLSFPSYLIHGVDERKAYGIGMRVTHGCIRMYPEDIESLFSQVSVGTQVLIVNEPIKLGRLGERIFLEVHQPLEENEDEVAPIAPRVTPQEVFQFVQQRLGTDISLDKNQLVEITARGDGIPAEIARTFNPLVGMVRSAGQQTPTASSEQVKRGKSALDEEYERALSRHLQEDESQKQPQRPAPPRELPRRATTARDPDDMSVTDVQRYLEDRY